MKMPGGRSGILSLSIKDKAALYSAYMPFVTNGGLFVATDKNYKLGEEIFLLLNIMDEPEKIPVAGKVVWITPQGAQGNRSGQISIWTWTRCHIYQFHFRCPGDESETDN